VSFEKVFAKGFISIKNGIVLTTRQSPRLHCGIVPRKSELMSKAFVFVFFHKCKRLRPLKGRG
jgi:hypothetical protein